jgi:hypothetical protein
LLSAGRKRRHATVSIGRIGLLLARRDGVPTGLRVTDERRSSSADATNLAF